MIRSSSGGLAAASLCLLLAACGGGGSDPAPAPPPPPPAPTALPASVTIAAQAQAETGATVKFSTSLTDTAGVTFLWDFGDGTTGAGAAPEHAYAKSGTYEVTVSLANAAEDLRLASFTVTIGAFSNVAGLDCSNGTGGWCWQDTLVTGHQVGDVFALPGTAALWAVGSYGTIALSTDGGASWKTVPSGVTDPLVKVRFRDATHGIVLTAGGYLLQTTDGGLTWTRNDVAGLLDAAPSLVAYDSGQIVLAGSQGRTISSHDDGATWTAITLYAPVSAGTDCWSVQYNLVTRSANCTGSPTQVLPFAGETDQAIFDANQVSFIDATHGMLMAQAWDGSGYWVSRAFVTSDGGLSWQRQDAGTGYWTWGYDLHMADASDAWWHTSNGWMATSDAAAHWTAVPLPGDIYSYNLAQGVLGTQLWASSGSRIALTPDYGQTWWEMSAPEAALNGQWGLPAQVIQWTDANDALVGLGGRYYLTHDGGNTWTRVLGPDPRDVGRTRSAIRFTDAKHGLLAISGGSIQTTSDGGRTWQRQDVKVTSWDQPVALQFSSAVDGRLLLDGKLWHTADGGASWGLPVAPGGAYSFVVATSWIDAADGWAAVTNDPYPLYATHDGGRTWSPVTLPANAGGLISVAFADASTGIVVTGWNQVLRTTDAGKTWQLVAGASGALEVVAAGPHTFWSTGATIARSDDDGVTWKTLLPSDGTLYRGLQALDGQQAQALANGAVIATADAGITWTQTSMPGDVSLGSSFALDALTVWGVTTNGQVLATATGGR
jgi:photosystem II stability/assembly factor-like uncharacterized protein